MKEAKFYEKMKNSTLQCQLCPHFCVLRENETGKCKIRKNIQGALYSLSYGKPISVNLDPITKKPLYNYLRNTFTFSIGMAGCNMSCLFCQNWEISQKSSDAFKVKEISPKELVNMALKSGCPSISYTYTEPFVSYEYVFDCAKLAKKKGLKNILVTNGYINPEPFEKIAIYIDAMNIDLKSFSEKTYNKFCGAKLKPILDTIKRAYKKKIHIEITTLVVPGLNDSYSELKKIAKFIYGVDKKGKIPWHISRFFPRYKMANKPLTPIKILKEAEKIGKKTGLNYVYIGNV